MELYIYVHVRACVYLCVCNFNIEFVIMGQITHCHMFIKCYRYFMLTYMHVRVFIKYNQLHISYMKYSCNNNQTSMYKLKIV